MVRLPSGEALVQTLDFLTPVVNDPYLFGRIAAANSLSDVYAMGGEPYTAMNIVCFPAKTMDKGILREILAGGHETVRLAGAVMAGGHSVEDPEIKYGLSVTGLVDPGRFASNKGLRPGDHLLLTKPLGTGILATALKGDLDPDGKIERIIGQWAARLNAAGGRVIRELGLLGATDVTGFGLGGHFLEMARASNVSVELWLSEVPVIEEALEFAAMGLIPEGSHANRDFCSGLVSIPEGADPLRLDMVFDAQTSGGLILAVPEDKLSLARTMLLDAGELAAHIGRVVQKNAAAAKLSIL